MKTRILILMSLAVVFTMLTSCKKNDPPVTLITRPILKFPQGFDTIVPAPVPETKPDLPSGPTTILGVNCTGAMVGFNVPDDGIQRVDKGMCVDSLPYPTTSDIVGYTEDTRGFAENNLWFNSWSCIDGLQPATHYYARAWYNAGDSTFYSEQISFSTNSRPVIKTGKASRINATSVIIGGNVTSTGGSFVVERGICYSTTDSCPDHPYINVQYKEQEVQSPYGTGEFSIQLTGLTPGTLYYARAFVGVMTGIEYGDQLFAFGDVVKFVTK